MACVGFSYTGLIMPGRPLLKRLITLALSVTVLAPVVWTPPAQAATETEKLAAIRKGLAYLHTTQRSGGSWGASGDEQAATGAAVFALLSQKDKWGDSAAGYRAAVERGMSYLLTTANAVNVSARNNSVSICPAAAATCTGVYWFGAGQSTYATGIVAPAIATYGAMAGATAVATTTGPLAGMTWGQIAQAVTNVLAASQSTGTNGDRAGGWGRFIPGNGDSDSTSTHWAVVSLTYNEAVGASTPQVVRNDLKLWLRNVQRASGATCMQPDSEPCGVAETGAALLAMKFVGYELTGAQKTSALSFLNTSWQQADDNATRGPGENPQWPIYTGLERTIGLSGTPTIINSLPGCGVPPNDAGARSDSHGLCTWSEAFSHWLVANQNPQGYWGDDPNAASAVTNALYVSILGGTHIGVLSHPLPASDTPAVSRDVPKVTTRTALTSEPVLAVPSMASASAAPIAAVVKKLRQRVRNGPVAVALNGDGTTIMSAGSDDQVRLWSATNGQQLVKLPAAGRGLMAAFFGRDGKTVSTAGRDSLLSLWDAGNGTRLAKFAGHEHAIRAVVGSPDGAFLASAGEDTRIMLWNLTTRKLSKVLYGATDFVNSLAFSPDSRLLASADESGQVLIFDVATGRSLYTLRGHSGPLDSVAFSPDGSVLASAGQDTTIHLWNPATGQPQKVLQGHTAAIRAIAFSPDGRLITSAGEDKQIRTWNVTAGSLNKVLGVATGAVDGLTFDPKGRFLLSADEAGLMTLWHVTSGLKLLTIAVPGRP